MKCPYCNEEMEQGYLQAMRRVAWVKQIHKVSLLPKQGEVLLENNTSMAKIIMLVKPIYPMYNCIIIFLQVGGSNGIFQNKI